MTFRKEGFSMGIGAIMAYQPYIYNTNTVSAKSLEIVLFSKLFKIKEFDFYCSKLKTLIIKKM